MADTTCIAEPLSGLESEVLRAYAAPNAVEVVRAMLDRPGDPAYTEAFKAAVERLKARGFLQAHARGMLVTPEGVAAALS